MHSGPQEDHKEDRRVHVQEPCEAPKAPCLQLNLNLDHATSEQLDCSMLSEAMEV